jgi:hypothetical protein
MQPQSATESEPYVRAKIVRDRRREAVALERCKVVQIALGDGVSEASRQQ